MTISKKDATIAQLRQDLHLSQIQFQQTNLKLQAQRSNDLDVYNE